LPVDRNAHSFTDFEWINGSQFAALKGNVDEANGYFAIVAAVNDGIDVDLNSFVSRNPFSPVLHNRNSVGPHSRSERHS